MKEECLICGAPLEYLETDVQMQCEICRKKELAKTRCVNGHYVCSDCHMQGLDSIVELCLRETACDPVAIVERMMALPSCHMHGPEHHVMVGAAADGVSQRRRRHCPFRRAHGGAAPRQKRARRRVRLLGRVRRGDQHGDVRLDHLRVNAADRRAVCAVAQNDGGRARADR